MAAEYKDVAALRAFAQTLRGSAGIHQVHAALYRDYVVGVAVYAADLPDLAPDDETFIREVCAGIDGLRDDVNRRVYVPAEILYRLSCFDAPPGPSAAPDPALDPAPEPKRQKKVKP